MADIDVVARTFCEHVNGALARGATAADAEETAVQALTRAGVGGGADADVHLIDALRGAFRQADEPDMFFNQRVLEPADRFEQCHELLRVTFDEAERDPLDRFLYMLRMLQDPQNDHPLVMIGRFWRVQGPQDYDVAGTLRRFTYDPLSTTDSIVGVASGNYMSLQRVRGEASGIGALGHLATRERFRRGRGHGSALLHAFEAEVERIARARGETVRLLALEAQAESAAFWYKQGYQWVVGTRYAQPPLEFDPATGERLHDEVPETLMVKVPAMPAATSVPGQLLADAVRTMYQNWALEKAQGYGPLAARRAEEYVMGRVFRTFLASLPADGEVALGPPPAV